ncbi:MAG: bifunctional adenosylcobinamide kinase/adenosylcobinamide-phosphate guanylyltransferase [Deltaproteobacteria bacterium]|nr:bifunctional adenosylcobinamide kinase/adenosylcobinamide-phosphate guanylyltransferase [Deltaproteobacteria bacterium]
MALTILITGGARSGKSVLAEKLALEFPAPLCYLATAETLDVEMEERVRQHRERRGEQWHTLEEPLDLLLALKGCDGRHGVILVDCITLWLSNLLFASEISEGDLEELVLSHVRQLAECLRELKSTVILVSNEVGMGIVPENRLARLYRDIAGRANQLLAAAADEVHVVISGIPLRLK